MVSATAPREQNDLDGGPIEVVGDRPRDVEVAGDDMGRQRRADDVRRCASCASVSISR